jgi:hypothetical protein
MKTSENVAGILLGSRSCRFFMRNKARGAFALAVLVALLGRYQVTARGLFLREPLILPGSLRISTTTIITDLTGFWEPGLKCRLGSERQRWESGLQAVSTPARLKAGLQTRFSNAFFNGARVETGLTTQSSPGLKPPSARATSTVPVGGSNIIRLGLGLVALACFGKRLSRPFTKR